MVQDEFYHDLQVVRLENSVLFAAIDLKDIGYELLHDTILNNVREIKEKDLEKKYEKLLNIAEYILEIETDDEDVKRIKGFMILRNEFPDRHKKYIRDGTFSSIDNDGRVRENHRICRIGDYKRVKNFLETGTLSRNL